MTFFDDDLIQNKFAITAWYYNKFDPFHDFASSWYILISINPGHQIYMDLIGCNNDPCLIVELLVKWAWLASWRSRSVSSVHGEMIAQSIWKANLSTIEHGLVSIAYQAFYPPPRFLWSQILHRLYKGPSGETKLRSPMCIQMQKDLVMHVKELVVHDRVWWIIETLK